MEGAVTIMATEKKKDKRGSRATLLKRIIEFRPDLLELSWTEKGVIERARKLGWSPRPKRAKAKKEATAA